MANDLGEYFKRALEKRRQDRALASAPAALGRRDPNSMPTATRVPGGLEGLLSRRQEDERQTRALARAPAALSASPPAALSPAIAGAPLPVITPVPQPASAAAQFTPEQRLADVNAQMGVVEAEGRLLTKAGGVGTGEYNTLIKRHRDLHGQRRFLQRAYLQPTAPSINEHPIEALDRLRAEGQGQ